MTKAAPDDNIKPMLGQALQRFGHVPQAVLSLNFALAKQFEDLGEYAEVVPALQKGCRALLSQTPYDEASEVLLQQRTLAEYNRALLEASLPGCPSDEPLFIIGMRGPELRSSNKSLPPGRSFSLPVNCRISHIFCAVIFLN